jgi:hypothetical protein
MTQAVRTARRATAADLRRVIEPLAGYICAADRPRALLDLAYSILFHEVAEVTQQARAHVAVRRTARTAPAVVELADAL